MIDKCERCGADLVGDLEKVVKECSACIKKMAQEELQDLRVDKEASTQTILKLSQQLAEAQKKIKRYESLRSAETQGIVAAQRGLPETENLYKLEDDSELHVMWAAGHAQGSAAREIQKFESMMLWAVGSLTTIAETAGEETRAKIESITTKLGEHLSLDLPEDG